jgi:Ca2+-binding EF-hand superfamily protein
VRTSWSGWFTSEIPTPADRGERTLKNMIIIVTCAVAMSSSAIAQVPSATPTAEDDRQLTIIFGRIDANRDGRITKPEMSAFGASHGLGVLVRNEGWKAMDGDRNGTIDRMEFVRGMVEARAAKAAREAKRIR